MKAKIPLFNLLRNSVGLAVFTGVLACVWPENALAGLTHRYSFTSDASDSVGGANGTLMNSASVSDGQAYFGGAVVSGANADYIDLPPGLISNYTTVTFEFWVDVGVNGTWEEIYAFGNQTSGGAGANMIMFCPHSGSTPNDYRMSYAQAAPGYNDEYVVNGVGVLDLLGPMSVTCVYDPPNQTMSLYTNGVLVASVSPVTARFSLTNVHNVHSWLGRSLYNGDQSYAGSMDEFRIYDAALGPLQIAVDNEAGPDTVVSSIVVNSIAWNVNTNMLLGERQDTTVTFNTASYGTHTVPGSTEATYFTSDPGVATVDVRGRVFATGEGTATVSAAYGGTTNNVVLNVAEPQLAHRYSFTTDVSDSVGGANGTLGGSASISGGAVVLTGGANSSDAGISYVDLPNNLVSSLTAITLETWVTDNLSGPWARIWDLGNSAGGEDISDTGSRYMFLSLPSGSGDVQGSVHVSDRAGGDQAVIWAGGGRPRPGTETHLVWVGDPAHHSGSLYADGALVGINTNVTLTPQDIGSMFNDWLGRSQYGGDDVFNGTIDEFRIWSGALSPLRVAINAAVGPDTIGPSDPGTLQSIRLSLDATIIKGGHGYASVAGDFSSVSNVNVSTLGTTYSSSDTNVATVDANGLIQGISVGTATITATDQGMTDSKQVAVVVKPVVLTHRWSFNETEGTTVADSIGGADGTLQGGAVAFGDGTITLDGLASYIDLPGHMIDGYDAVTLETWVTVSEFTLNDDNARLFALGSLNGANEISVTALTTGNNSLIRYAGPPAFTATRQKGLVDTPLGKMHIVAVFNAPLGRVDLFLNGSWQNSATNLNFSIASITNLVSRLGANVADPAAGFTAATFDEFRIYNGALDLMGIRTSYAAGPNNVVTNPGTRPRSRLTWMGRWFREAARCRT